MCPLRQILLACLFVCLSSSIRCGPRAAYSEDDALQVGFATVCKVSSVVVMLAIVMMRTATLTTWVGFASIACLFL